MGILIIGVLLGIAGDIIFAAAVVTLRDSWRAGIAEKDNREMITLGIYKISRNPAFSVIGKEGSTDDGEGVIKRLWNEANSHFKEIEHLAKKDEAGNISGIWGIMSDFSHSFKPWEENYSKGVYLAGVETIDGAKAPEGWTKWTIPGYEYLYVKCTEENIFPKVIAYMQEQGLELAGAVHDFNCPVENGQGYMFFPIRRLSNGEEIDA